MRSTTLITLAAYAASSVSGHCIFQRLSINGVDQGSLTGVRAPSSNNPVLDVSTSAIACNTGLKSPVSNAVVTIPAGAKVGAWYQHVIGGPQKPNDADNPIAPSHKGPVMAYLAKVDSAATSDGQGLKWFKVAEEGLDTSTGKWGVDSMIAGNGWWYFNMPTCVAPGEYLLRVELIALHSAYSNKGAQFYLSCANIKITGTGTATGTQTVSFPGAYTADDVGIKLNIYNGTIPNNNLKPYTVPGPAVMKC